MRTSIGKSVSTLQSASALKKALALVTTLAVPALLGATVSFAAAPRVKPLPGASVDGARLIVRVPGVTTRVVANGLARPTGILAGPDGAVYFTEIPAPGQGGGPNGVLVLDAATGAITRINQGEPEPVNLAMGVDGSLYWTCRSAGVILRRDPSGNIAPLLAGLEKPNGIAVDGHDVYFTQLPTPGVPGSMGGRNTVNLYQGGAIEVLTLGEPEPTDIVVGRDGTIYWTCRSAGVVLRRTADGTVGLLLAGLDHPTGIALDESTDTLYLTEVPTPGVPGTRGGRNRVTSLDLATGERGLVDFGDPEPTGITVAPDGTLYWTCSSAGVIVEARVER